MTSTRQLLFNFMFSDLSVSPVSLCPPQGGRRGEALRHQQDEHGLRLRRALQPVRLSEGAGAALPAHLAGPAQRLAQRHAGLPRLQPAEAVTPPTSPVASHDPAPELQITVDQNQDQWNALLWKSKTEALTSCQGESAQPGSVRDQNRPADKRFCWSGAEETRDQLLDWSHCWCSSSELLS